MIDTWTPTSIDKYSRISLRMIMRLNIEAYQAVNDDHHNIDSKYSYIDPNCAINEVVKEAYRNSKEVCEQTYRFNSPNINLEEINTVESNQTISCAYPRTHLHLILFEVLKNAMRAVIEHSEFVVKQQLNIADYSDAAQKNQLTQFLNMVETEIANRPIDVKIYKGTEDITILINDSGGGFPFSLSYGLFQYLFTTANINLLHQNNICSTMHTTGVAPIAGFGCGLPISRLYARYFTGDLKISTIEGRGTTAYVYLKAKPSEAREIIPVYTSVMKKIYRSQSLAPQWTSKKK
ncbi:hypothetical protein GJ496_011997 [Pomphorhynchus laevis]|nr:hypothetical protein GJ496_011997 [Pomphorhynchus laevis]